MSNSFPSRETVNRIREQYPAGTRIELISMEDPYNTKLRPGDKGTVSRVDDIGTIFVAWDSGSGLGLVHGVDRFKRVEQTLTGELSAPMELLEKTAAYILETSARETTSGNYIIHANDLPAEVISPELFAANIDTLAGILSEYGAVLDIDVYDGAIDMTVGLAYCPNYEPFPEEEEEFPDDRETSDPLATRGEGVLQGGFSALSESGQKLSAQEEKPSVLKQIREAQNAPKPHNDKATMPKKNKGFEEI